jgi:biopolymer transport protein ExbD
MIRRKHGKSRDAPELDITAFLNLMVVLVPFLLVSAVFSRITIMELNMPASAGGAAATPAKISVEVVIREDVMEISDGRRVIIRFPKIDNPDPEAEIEDEKLYDLVKLTNYLLKIKANFPDKTDSTILIEPDIEYRHLVRVMDAVRNAEIVQENTAISAANDSSVGGEPNIQIIELFPDISIGDAP